MLIIRSFSGTEGQQQAGLILMIVKSRRSFPTVPSYNRYFTFESLRVGNQKSSSSSERYGC